MTSRKAFSLLLLIAGGCATTPRVPEQKLYFSLQVWREGKLVAKPKLLGETGKIVRAERRHPGAALPDYDLVLRPRSSGDRYDVTLDLSVPELSGHLELALLHGEVRQVELGPKPGELQVQLLLMRVDSQEFRTLMDLSERAAPESPGSI